MPAVARPVLFVPGQPASVPVSVAHATSILDQITGFDKFIATLGAKPEELTSVFDFSLFGLMQATSPTNELVKDLVNLGGYTLYEDDLTVNPTLFVAAQDWRMQVAPFDGVDDGMLTNLTAQSIAGDVFANGGDGIYNYGVDYLGYWMIKAMDAWVAAGGDPSVGIDVISHSEGYLLTRAYVSSAAYGGTYVAGPGPGGQLPRIANWISLAGPNEGASGVYNLLQNNFSNSLGSDPAGGLYLFEEAAYLRVTDPINPQPIFAPDGSVAIDPADVASGAISDLEFIQLYIGSLRDEMPTYAFLDGADVNGNATFRNNLLLDVNGGADPNDFVTRLDSYTAIYGTKLPTYTSTTTRLGEGGTLLKLGDVGAEADVLLQFLLTGNLPPTQAGDVWLLDNEQTNAGDGTVATLSSASTFVGDPRFTLLPQHRREIDHDAAVSDPRIHRTILEILQPGLVLPTADHFETSTWVDYSTNTGWSPQLVGDFNGDGRDDVANFLASNGGWYISLSTGTSFLQPLRWVDLANSGFTQHLVGDFNGDGRDDIASFYSPNGVWYVSISTGLNSFTKSGWVDLASSGWTTQQVGDFNGDGRDDIASLYSDGRWYVSISNGTSFTNSSWNTVGTGWTRLVVGDFNGDSRDDVAGFRFSTGSWYVSLSSGTSFGPSTNWATIAASWVNQIVGDFNNDGLDDIAGLYSGDGRWYVSLSSGADFTTVGWGPSNGTSGWTRHVVADFNGDGIDDLAGFRNIDGSWWTSLSTGSSFEYTRWADLVNGGWSSPVTGNFNGDSFDDVAGFRTVTGTWHVGLASPPVMVLRLAGAAIHSTGLNLNSAADAGRLTQAQLNATVAQAFSIFANLGVNTRAFGSLSFAIADLAGNILGQARSNVITLDVNAAGHGWSLGDALDADDVDLLSVLLHELGHELGLEHGAAAFMAETIGLGERRLPTAAELDDFLRAS